MDVEADQLLPDNLSFSLNDRARLLVTKNLHFMYRFVHTEKTETKFSFPGLFFFFLFCVYVCMCVLIYIYISRIQVTCWLSWHIGFSVENSQNYVDPGVVAWGPIPSSHMRHPRGSVAMAISQRAH